MGCTKGRVFANKTSLKESYWCPVVEHEGLWKDIVPANHPSLQPAQLAESGKETLSIENNDLGQAAEKAPLKPGRKRRKSEEAEMSKHIKLLMSRNCLLKKTQYNKKWLRLSSKQTN